jgi:hypothetical protein
MGPLVATVQKRSLMPSTSSSSSWRLIQDGEYETINLYLHETEELVDVLILHIKIYKNCAGQLTHWEQLY